MERLKGKGEGEKGKLIGEGKGLIGERGMIKRTTKREKGKKAGRVKVEWGNGRENG